MGVLLRRNHRRVAANMTTVIWRNVWLLYISPSLFYRERPICDKKIVRKKKDATKRRREWEGEKEGLTTNGRRPEDAVSQAKRHARPGVVLDVNGSQSAINTIISRALVRSIAHSSSFYSEKLSSLIFLPRLQGNMHALYSVLRHGHELRLALVFFLFFFTHHQPAADIPVKLP